MHLSGVDLNLLPLLDALLTERSVTRAGRRVGLSQSAASHALGRLRYLLGDPLLVRRGGRLSPTARAEALVEPVRDALATLQRALLEPTPFDPSTARRTFRVVANDYVQFLILPRLLADLGARAPGVDLWVRPHREPSLDALGGGEVELVMTLMRDAERPPGVRREALLDERFVCVVRRGHPLASGALTLPRFVRARHALVAPRGTPGGIVDDTLAGLGLERRVVLAVPDFLAAPFVVAESDLVLTLAARVATAMARRLPLEILEPPVRLPGFRMGLYWHERDDADPGLTWMRRQIHDVAAAIDAKAPRARAPRRR